MANTAYLRTDVEPYLVKMAAKEFGIMFRKQTRSKVRRRSDGTFAQFNFDGVSEDASTGVLASAALSIKHGVMHKLHRDASVLLNARFKQRIMVFANKKVMEVFKKNHDGLLQLSKIDMRCYKLPPKMRESVAALHATAKAENSKNTGRKKVGGKQQ